MRAAALIAPPIIVAQPANASAVEGQTATFAVDVIGAGPVTYQWLRNGVPIPGATSATYTTPALNSAADNGAVYTVVTSTPLVQSLVQRRHLPLRRRRPRARRRPQEAMVAGDRPRSGK